MAHRQEAHMPAQITELTTRFLISLSVSITTTFLNAQQVEKPISFATEELRPLGGHWQITEENIRADGSPAKLMLGKKTWSDFDLTVDVKVGNRSQAGVIFRVTNAGDSLDQYDGYYIGIDAANDSLVWGAANSNWSEIAQRPTNASAEKWHTIRLIARGNQIQAWVQNKPLPTTGFPKFDGIDNRYKTGGIGLRSLGGHAEFRNLIIKSPKQLEERRTYTNPVQPDIADPTVILDGNTYYAYATHSKDHPIMKRGIRLYTSENLIQWRDCGYVIKEEQSWGKTRFWAPDIIKRNNIYYLYYATDTRICVAQSKHPMGPFKELNQSPIEPESVRIDAHAYQDNGRIYLYYVRFNKGNEIWGGELNDDMVTLKQDSLRLMIRPDQPWERHQAAITEGPAILKHNGLYYLTYSGSHFESPNYAVGYATSESPLGPWVKYPYNPIMKSTAYAHGTAHHCFTTSPDGKETFIVYHQHRDLTRTEPRQMSIDRVQFVKQDQGPDRLEIHGPTNSPQPFPSGVN